MQGLSEGSLGCLGNRTQNARVGCASAVRVLYRKSKVFFRGDFFCLFFFNAQSRLKRDVGHDGAAGEGGGAQEGQGRLSRGVLGGVVIERPSASEADGTSGSARAVAREACDNSPLAGVLAGSRVAMHFGM